MKAIPVQLTAALAILFMTVSFSSQRTCAQQIVPVTGPAEGVPAPPEGPNPSALTPLVELTDKYTHPDLEIHYLNRTSPVATISGVSGSARSSDTIFYPNERISREVTANPFQPPDLISAEVPLALVSPRNADEGDINGSGTAAVNYDSNIRRDSGNHLADYYANVGAGIEARSGTTTDPVAVDLTYGYSEDIFARQRQFNTRTHNFLGQARIGRWAFILQPYVLGRFRSVDDQSAAESGRESSNFLLEGVHGEMTPASGAVYNFDLSHTGVTYPAYANDNFQEWSATQEFDFSLLNYQKRSYVEKIVVFPWLDLKDIVPTDFAAVRQMNGGVGAAISLLDHLVFRGEFGWGSVASSDSTVNYGAYSGSRYVASLSYQASRNFAAGVSYAKVLSFTPRTIGRVTEQAEAFVTAPLNLDSHLEIVPRVAFYSATSDDYTVDQSNIYGDFELAAVYKFNGEFGIFAKTKYTTNFRTTSGVDTEINDFQNTAGVSILF